MTPRGDMHFIRILMIAGLVYASRPLFADAVQPIMLRNAVWTVSLHPGDLTLEVVTPDNVTQRLSDPQPDLGPVLGLEHTTSHAQWRLPEQQLTVRAELDGQRFRITLESEQAGEFTWPVMALRSPIRALIWPSWEGSFVPLDDARWRTFLRQNEWNTLEGLTMPFWGLWCGEYALTFIVTNRFNNALTFDELDGDLRATFTHTFPKTKKKWQYGFVIELNESASPVEPARVYRRWLIEQGDFVSLAEKVKATPKVARLLGAPHAYIWGDAYLSRHDIRPRAWQDFAQTLVSQAQSERTSVGQRLHAKFDEEAWRQVEALAEDAWAGNYAKSTIALGLSQALQQRDFYSSEAWQGVDLGKDCRALLAKDRATLTKPELCRMNGLLLQAAYPRTFLPIDEWGDGVSLKMLQQLKAAGLEHMRLCLDGWAGIKLRPQVARVADEMGYLFGTYDSYHSIHDPKYQGTDKTWETAQFDQHLFDTGGIERADGKKRGGFMQLGYLLSPHAARPYVERRVKRNLASVPFNYYFVDCDAFGQVYDDYSKLHPSTQAQDAAARIDRLNWICNTFDMVIGSEGGCSLFAPAIHVAEGMLTPVIGWGDADMKDRNSPYYVGAYYPPDGPTIYVQPTKLKDEYVYWYEDPRFRLPLNEIVFHDAFVSTHHWGSGSLKFTNVRDTAALTEMLYQCPPLYHLNLDEFKQHRDWIVRHYQFWSPIHRQVGFKAMTDFQWLTPDRLVQRTRFGDKVELTANYSENDFEADGLKVPARSVAARGLGNRSILYFSPTE